MRILCIGLNHKTAGVALRERLSFDPHACSPALANLRDQWPSAEFLLLSTCNRTEIYLARPVHGHPREEELHLWLARWQGVSLDQFVGSLYNLADADAMDHMFEVACGLDSLVPGEAQIVQQLKRAYDRSAEIEASGPIMHMLVQAALHVAKHVRNETDIGAGRVSVASVAIDCACERLESLTGKSVLSVGAGKMNRLMLQHLRELGVGEMIITNRTRAKADELAQATGGRPVPFEEFPRHLAEADIVLCSTASDTPLIRRKDLRQAMAGRNGQEMLILDLAVPRDVEQSVTEISGVHLYNIDDLQGVVQRTLHERNSQRDQAQPIIEEHREQLRQELNVRAVAPTIKALYEKMNLIADEELSSAANKFAEHDDTEEDLEILRLTLHRTIRRMLHPCTANLRSMAGTDLARADVAALQRLFDLAGQEAALGPTSQT
jgi:glutamyl-tRNA reductase